jgi:bifunctional non-homologous end joining protein LigD
MLWDRGEYEDRTGNPTAAFYAGKLHLILRGVKLKKEWVLVKDRQDEEGNKWLLIKTGESLPDISNKMADSSVVTARSMAEIARANDAQWKSNRSAAPTKTKSKPTGGKRVKAQFIEPMLCKAVTALPKNDNWSFEIKFDGYRCLAVKSGLEVTLFSRNRKVFNDRFPNITEAVKSIEGDFVLDGEIVALDIHGRPSFQLLQNNRSDRGPVYLYIFDLLVRNGEALLSRTIEDRRQQLRELLPDPWILCVYRRFWRPLPTKSWRRYKSLGWKG